MLFILRLLLQPLPTWTLSQYPPTPQPVQFLLPSCRHIEPSDFLVTIEIQRKHHPLLNFPFPQFTVSFLECWNSGGIC